MNNKNEITEILNKLRADLTIVREFVSINSEINIYQANGGYITGVGALEVTDRMVANLHTAQNLLWDK
jgi:hypothetical protein